MGEVEMSINEEGTLKVVQHYDLRVFLRRLRQEGFERHRVVKWPNCNCLSKRVPEATFNRLLKFFFLFLLSLPVINVIIFEQLFFTRSNGPSTWDYISDQTWLFGRKGIVPLAIFAAVVAVGVFVKKAMKNTGSAPPRREEVQTISALVQQV